MFKFGMRVEPQQLKAFLLDAGLVTEKQFEEAQEQARKKNQKVEDILLNENLLSEEELIKLKAYILGIPFVDLEKEKVDLEILRLIPEPIARSHNIVAFRKKGNNLEVAMIDPEDLQTIEFIKKQSGLKILPRLTTSASIKQVLQQYQKTLEAEFREIIKKEAPEIRPVEEAKIGDKEELEKVAQELPVIKIVDTLIKHAILERASDIHIEPTEKELVVRYRIDGILRDAMILPTDIAPGVVARIKILSNLKIDEHRLPQDGRFKIETEDYRYALRVSVLPVYDGEKIVMRLLPEAAKGMTLEELGLWGDMLESTHFNLKRPVGMILVTGPTGSGKTTTLYSMLQILNTPGVNISTIEDPIEYRMPRINQTQVNPKVGLTFANGLRALVRQDPDILMVGEIRDEETASLAVNAALTGHLVLSTLHTNSAAGALPRLLDMKVEPFLIASTVNIILAQRLVRRLCEPKTKYVLTKDELGALAKEGDLEKVLAILKERRIVDPKATWATIQFFHPTPSKDCPDGYQGRFGIFEILNVTETIKTLILRNASAMEIQHQAQKEGMLTMLEDGFMKAVQGFTTIEEVLRVSRE